MRQASAYVVEYPVTSPHRSEPDISEQIDNLACHAALGE
jgi:hypothetical protein